MLGAGAAAGWVAKPASDRVEKEYVAVPVVVVPGPTPAPAPVEYATAERLELEAELTADGAAAAHLYRRAGDQFLADRGDSAQAARCYRLFLMRAGGDELRVSSDDSWLLSALKLDRKREMNHDSNEGL